MFGETYRSAVLIMTVFSPFPPVLAFVAAMTVFGTSARADDALAAVAANFAGAAKDIAAAFEATSEHSVTITTGSTGKLYAQIAQAAPFDLFLSADAKTAERIEKEGLGEAGSRFTYAIGMLVLWSSDASRIGADPKAALLDSGTLKIAIANPDLAPYGAAAREAMQAMGVWDAVQGKIVMGENVGQAYSMVDTGAAQAGFVAASALASNAGKGSHYDVPQGLFTPIRQDAVLLNPGKTNEAARAFMAFLKSEEAKAIARKFGYDAP